MVLSPLMILWSTDLIFLVPEAVVSHSVGCPQHVETERQNVTALTWPSLTSRAAPHSPRCLLAGGQLSSGQVRSGQVSPSNSQRESGKCYLRPEWSQWEKVNPLVVKKVLRSAVAVATWQGGKVVPDVLPPSLPAVLAGFLSNYWGRQSASQQGQLGTRESPEVLGGIDLELLIDLLLCSSM